MFNEHKRGHHYVGSFANVGFEDFQERHYAIAAVVAGVLAVVAAGVGTYVAVQQAEQQADEANAIRKQKEEEARQAVESAAFQERQLRRRQSILLGKQQAITAAAGVDLTTGTALFAEADFAEQAELEALNVRRTGKIEASGREFEARIAKFRRENARGAIPWLIAGGVLSASSSAATSYSVYKNPKTYKTS